MPKKKSRKSRKSNGVVGSPATARTSVGMKRLLNQQAAWAAGKKVMLLVPGRDKSEAWVKVRAEAIWGTPVNPKFAPPPKEKK